MSSRTEEFDRTYSRNLAEYYADPENTAGFPPALFERYQHPENVLCETEDKGLYVVRRKSDGAKAFLKVTKRQPAENAGQEAKILAALDHPAIPRVLDYWEHGENCFLLREYFEGVTLGYLAGNEGLLGVAAAMDIAAQLGDVLVYLEQQAQPVVNRDIKPTNIVLTPDNKCKLVDFSTARLYDPAKLHDTVLAGSEGFISPEQYGYGQSGPAADLYGLGASLLYITTGTWDLKAGLAKTKDCGLAYLVRKCCEFTPEHRFPSAAALIRHIAYLRDGFVPPSDRSDMHGTTLERYAGNGSRVLLQGISHITDTAFSAPYHTGGDIEALVLSSIFSPHFIGPLRQLENLHTIYIEDENPELACCNGALYSKDLSRLLFVPAKKSGVLRLPAQTTDIEEDALADLFGNTVLEAVETDPESKRYTSPDGMLYDRRGKALLYCPRGKEGTVRIPPGTEEIQPEAFLGCAKLAGVLMPEDPLGRGQRYGHYLCELFEGCTGLPAAFQHEWVDYDSRFPAGREAKCMRCNAIRDADHQYPPPFGKDGLAPHRVVPDTDDVDIDGKNLYLKYVEKIETRRWRTTGRTIGAQELKDWLTDYYPDTDEIVWRVDPNLLFQQMEWASDEELHPGVTRGTLGGWIERGAFIGDTAWVDKGAFVFKEGRVFGRGRVSGRAWVKAGAWVFDHAVVDGSARLGHRVKVHGHAHVTGGQYDGHAKTDSYVFICGHACVRDEGRLVSVHAKGGDIRICDTAQVRGRPEIRGGNVLIGDSAHIEDSPEIFTGVHILGSARVFGAPKLAGNVHIDGNAQVGDRAFLYAVGAGLVEYHVMTDDNWADYYEDHDRNYNSYGHSEWAEEPHLIHIGGDASIVGDTLLAGSVEYTDNKVVNTGMDKDAIHFVRQVFNEETGQWVDQLEPKQIPVSVLHRLTFTVPALGIGRLSEIRITEQLAPYLSICGDSARYDNSPHPPKVYRNEMARNGKDEYSVTYGKHPYPMYDNFAADDPRNLGNTFVLQMTKQGLLQWLHAGDSISIYYRALVDTRAVVGDNLPVMASQATLAVNNLAIEPETEIHVRWGPEHE